MTEMIVHKITPDTGGITLCGQYFTINEKGEKIINGKEQIRITVYADSVTCPKCIQIWDNKLEELCNTH